MSDSLYQRILAHYTIYEGEVWHLHIFESDNREFYVTKLVK